jgi:hypothetical protein
LRKDGTVFPVEVSLSHYKIGETLFVIAFIIDITIRKENEKELQAKSATIRDMNVSLETKVQQRTMILRETLTELKNRKKSWLCTGIGKGSKQFENAVYFYGFA